MREGWRSIDDIPLDVARKINPRMLHSNVLDAEWASPGRTGWTSNFASGARSVVYDVDGEWYRIYVTKDNNVYYQRWVTFE